MPFLEKFLLNRLNQENEKAVISQYSTYNECLEQYILSDKYYLSCGRLNILFSSKLLLVVSKIVDSYNKEIEQAKKLQIRMEGF